MFLLFALSAFTALPPVHFTVTLLYALATHFAAIRFFLKARRHTDFLFLNVQSAEKYDHERAMSSLFFFVSKRGSARCICTLFLASLRRQSHQCYILNSELVRF